MSMLKRLLSSLHAAVFETSPDEEAAFRVRHANGASWSVVDEVMTASFDGTVFSYQLANLTVGQLAARLAADGFEVDAISPNFAGLSASVLVESTGNSAKSNGDLVSGFTNLIYSVLGGYARELRTVKAQIPEAMRQMVITSSEGEWLDLWGSLYNQQRRVGQDDASFGTDIPAEAFRIRVNALAIEKAIYDITGRIVHILEPWEEIFRLDFSKLSGGHKFYDGSTVGYHLIKPVADTAISWDGIMEIIARNKAAGVLVLPPEEHNRIVNNDPLDGTIWFTYDNFRGFYAAMWDEWRLDDNLVLSDSKPVVNYVVAETRLYSMTNWRAATWHERMLWDVEPWVKLYVPEPLLDPFTISHYTNIKATLYAVYGNEWKVLSSSQNKLFATTLVWPDPDTSSAIVVPGQTQGIEVDATTLEYAMSLSVNSYDGPDWYSNDHWGDTTWEG